MFFKAKNKDDWKNGIGEGMVMEDLSCEMPPCKTASCIAGTANLLTGGRKLSSAVRARKVLGLGDQELFHSGLWPYPFNQKYLEAKTPRQRAKIACARIDHLIKTGE